MGKKSFHKRRMRKSRKIGFRHCGMDWERKGKEKHGRDRERARKNRKYMNALNRKTMKAKLIESAGNGIGKKRLDSILGKGRSPRRGNEIPAQPVFAEGVTWK
jgi:hypothetical protein